MDVFRQKDGLINAGMDKLTHSYHRGNQQDKHFRKWMDGWLDGDLYHFHVPSMGIVFLRQFVYRTWCVESVLQPKVTQ